MCEDLKIEVQQADHLTGKACDMPPRAVKTVPCMKEPHTRESGLI